MDIQYKRNDKSEKMALDFKVGQEHFMIEVYKLEGYPDTVEITKYTDVMEDRQ